MESIRQGDVEILSKGLDMALFCYNEEWQKSKTFEKKAMYPITIIPVFFTLISFFIDTLHKPVIENYPHLTFCIALTIFVCYVVICTLLILMNKPNKGKATPPWVFCRLLDETYSMSSYYQYWISQIIEEGNILFHINEYKSRCLTKIYALFLIIIFLFMIIVTLSYF